MTDISPQLTDALSRVTGTWDNGRRDAAWLGMHRKRARRRAMNSMAAVAGVAVLLGGVYLWPDTTTAPSVASTDDAKLRQTRDNPARLVLEDGSVVIREDEAEVRVIRAVGDEVELAVVSGKSRFRLPSRRTRKLRIVAGEVRIAVYSSAFSVARYQTAAEVWTEVWVDEGHLELAWQGDTIRVAAGEHRRLAESAPPPPPPGNADKPRFDRDRDSRARSGERRRPRRQAPPPEPDWRSLARDGDFDAAYRLLAGGAALGNGVGDLLLAADVYRMSGHPRAAIAPLQRVVDGQPRDPRTPLAAFTLARILLEDLGRPAAAARAFRQARDLAPQGALAEDALAREVESWAKAGQAGKARERATIYLNTYPRGHRVRAVKQYGDL